MSHTTPQVPPQMDVTTSYDLSPEMKRQPEHYSPQQQYNAPFPKWTPPNMSHFQPDNSSTFVSDQGTEYDQGNTLGIENDDQMTGPVAGQKGYEWQPPAALQAFQNSANDNIENPPMTSSQGETLVEDHAIEEHENADDEFTSFLSWAKLEDPADIEETLINDPAIGTVSDLHGNTFLHGACEVGNISLVQYFLKCHPVDSSTSLRHPNNQGFEPIHLAAFSGMMHIVM